MAVIKHALYARDEQFIGGTPWIKNDRCDIVAKANAAEPDPFGASTTMSPATFTSQMVRHQQRIQALLRDRFGLVLTTEMKVMSFYSLRIAKSGNNMVVAGDADLNPIVRGGKGHFEVTADMKGITAMLTDAVGRLVVDDTGLLAHYKVKLDWAQDLGNAVVGRASIFTALGEQLGLRLESKTGPSRSSRSKRSRGRP